MSASARSRRAAATRRLPSRRCCSPTAEQAAAPTAAGSPLRRTSGAAGSSPRPPPQRSSPSTCCGATRGARWSGRPRRGPPPRTGSGSGSAVWEADSTRTTPPSPTLCATSTAASASLWSSGPRRSCPPARGSSSRGEAHRSRPPARRRRGLAPTSPRRSAATAGAGPTRRWRGTRSRRSRPWPLSRCSRGCTCSTAPTPTRGRSGAHPRDTQPRARRAGQDCQGGARRPRPHAGGRPHPADRLPAAQALRVVAVVLHAPRAGGPRAGGHSAPRGAPASRARSASSRRGASSPRSPYVPLCVCGCAFVSTERGKQAGTGGVRAAYACSSPLYAGWCESVYMVCCSALDVRRRVARECLVPAERAHAVSWSLKGIYWCFC
ncbi:hypothetical protein EMIHUDRAFT_435854, partial [Emiliania huxleyi CCMP1516]|uniref:Uncharacterized protein n=2 Tax=Emiliania huxleyi TaxID=2903 RepID=A0A0D3JAG5_EMIH1